MGIPAPHDLNPTSFGFLEENLLVGEALWINCVQLESQLGLTDSDSDVPN